MKSDDVNKLTGSACVDRIQYGEIFVEVRQRVAAFKYWRKFLKSKSLESYPYGGVDENEYLDEAYRFLYMSASQAFIEFCANKENVGFDAYCDDMGIDKGKLIKD